MVSDSDGVGRGGAAPDRARPVEDDGAGDAGAGRAARSSLTVALVAGVVLLAGGGAYWAGAAATPGADRPGGAVPVPLVMDPAGDSGPLRVAGPLPRGPGVAPVYLPAGPVSRVAVARLAVALGVRGRPVERDGVWKAGPAGGRPGPTLQVGVGSPGAWAFAADGAGAQCQAPTASGALPGSGGGPVCFGPVARGGGAVSRAAAGRAAAPVLAALGLAGTRVDADRTAGALRQVTVDPVVGGLPTAGWRTTLQVGVDGKLVGGAGRLAALVAGARYPVVPAARAASGGQPALCGGGTARPGATGAGASGRRNLPCLAPERTVTGARFGLSARIVGGRPELVPAWLLTVDGGSPDAAAPQVVTRSAVSPEFVTAPPSAGAAGALSAPGGGAAVPGGAGSGGPGAVPPGGGMSYAADGRTLTLRFWGGVCGGYDVRAVAQGPDAVRVRVAPRADASGRPCPMLARRVTAHVTLERAVGGRPVYDAADGTRIPEGTG